MTALDCCPGKPDQKHMGCLKSIFSLLLRIPWFIQASSYSCVKKYPVPESNEWSCSSLISLLEWDIWRSSSWSSSSGIMSLPMSPPDSVVTQGWKWDQKPDQCWFLQRVLTEVTGGSPGLCLWWRVYRKSHVFEFICEAELGTGSSLVMLPWMLLWASAFPLR